MIVDAACRSEHNLNQLNTVWIPMKTVMSHAPKDLKFDFDGVKVSFDSMPDQWPENWVLWTVRFYRDDTPEEALVIDAPMLKQGRADLLSFDWKAGDE
jgi:hypothetical protein